VRDAIEHRDYEVRGVVRRYWRATCHCGWRTAWFGDDAGRRVVTNALDTHRAVTGAVS